MKEGTQLQLSIFLSLFGAWSTFSKTKNNTVIGVILRFLIGKIQSRERQEVSLLDKWLFQFLIGKIQR